MTKFVLSLFFIISMGFSSQSKAQYFNYNKRRVDTVYVRIYVSNVECAICEFQANAEFKRLARKIGIISYELDTHLKYMSFLFRNRYKDVETFGKKEKYIEVLLLKKMKRAGYKVTGVELRERDW